MKNWEINCKSRVVKLRQHLLTSDKNKIKMKRLKNLFVCLSLAIAVVSCNKGEEVWVDDSPIIQFRDPNFLKAFLRDRDA